MIPSEYGSAAPTSAKSVRRRYETTIRPPSSTRARSRARASQLQLRELDRLVHLLEHGMHVGACLDELSCKPQ